MRASADLGWASPPASASQALRQSPPAPGGVFVPQLLLALLRLLTLTLAFLCRLLVALQVGPLRMLLLRGFSSAPPGTPRDSGSEDSDSGSSSASAAVQLADLVYDFCPKARLVSDSAPPPRCGFESWFDPSPTSSSSRPRRRFCCARSAAMRLRISRFLRLRSR